MHLNTPRNPVLLIHGIDDTGVIFDDLIGYLDQLGWETHTLDLTPNCGAVGLDHLAQQIHACVSRRFPAGQPIDLIGFSMGGIVSRYYVQRLQGHSRVQRFVTIASPHQGTWVAYGRWNAGCQQMCPGSHFLTDLNRDVHVLDQLNFTSIWTPYDLMIVPAQSSRLPVGREIVLPVLLHSWMVRDRQSLDAIAGVLKEPLRRPQSLQSQGVSPTWA